MPIPDHDILVVDLKPLSLSQGFYLPEVFKGLGTTFKHLVGSIGRGQRNKAMCYPEERRDDRPNRSADPAPLMTTDATIWGGAWSTGMREPRAGARPLTWAASRSAGRS